MEEKTGQIAHLDHNPSNNNFENLAWMCQFHHEEYDVKRRQTKGYTIREAKAHRQRLYELIEKDMKEMEQTGVLTKSRTDSDSIPKLSQFSIQILKHINNPVAQRIGGCSYIELTTKFMDKAKLDLHLKHLLDEGYLTKNNLGYYILDEKGKLFFYGNTL